MATSRYGQNLTYEDNVTEYTGPEITRDHGVLDQISGALSALAPGVQDGWAVTAGSGLGVNAAAGEGIAAHDTYGAVALRSTGILNAVVPASSTGYIHALVEDDTSPGGNRSVETMVPKFVYSDLNVLANAVPVAYVVSGASSITTVLDRRRFLLPEGDVYGGMFAQDDANTVGLTVAFHGGRLAKSDGVLDVADFSVTIASGDSFIDLDEDGTAYVRTSSTPVSGHKCIWAATASSIEVVTAPPSRDRRTGFDFGSGGSVVDASTTVKGISTLSVAPASPTAPIAVGDNDSRMTNARTPTGHHASHDTGGTDPIAPADIGAATAADLTTHTSAAAPHSGHFDIDGGKALTGNADAGGFLVKNSTAPVDPGDLATKGYADSLISATAAPIAKVAAVSIVNVTLSGLQTIDGVSLGDGDRALLTGQTTTSENGPWVVHSGSWTRPADFTSGGTTVGGTWVFTPNGTARKGTAWALLTNGATIDTDPLAWTQIGSGGTGEANSGANVGTGAGLIFKDKSGVNLEFKSLKAGSSKLGVTNNADDITLDVVPGSIDRNDLGGADPLAVDAGGTGLDSFSEGDLIYASAANVLSAAAGNAATTLKYLSQVGDGTTPGAPAWATVSVPGYGGTSTTFVVGGTGNKSVTTQAGLAYVVGARVRLVDPGATSKYLEGVVTSYIGTALTFTADVASFGSGEARTNWNLTLAGQPGTGAVNFTDLADAPSSYAGETGKLVAVNGAESGVEFIEPPADFVASGTGHAHGMVPDPGASAGATKFLREDATWAVPSGGGGSLPSRDTVSWATSSLANGATETHNLSGFGKGGQTYTVETDEAAWVRLYSTSAARTADGSRSDSTDPPLDAGVLVDVEMPDSHGSLTIRLAPPIWFYNDDTSVIDTVYAAVTNKSGSTSVINVSITKVTLEG